MVVYVVTDPWLDDFRVFLERHAALLRALPAWTLRIVVPPQFPDIAQRCRRQEPTRPDTRLSRNDGRYVPGKAGLASPLFGRAEELGDRVRDEVGCLPRE